MIKQAFEITNVIDNSEQGMELHLLCNSTYNFAEIKLKEINYKEDN